MCARYTLRTPASIWTQAFFEAFDVIVDLPDTTPAGGADAIRVAEPRGEKAQPYLAPETKPRYNIAPTQNVWAIRWDEDSSRPAVERFHWGLLPAWATDRSIASKAVNARSESAATKPMFRDAFRSRRCVLPADGYFEWTRDRDGKKPHLFQRPDGEPFFMAGLWESNLSIDDEGHEIKSCTILTTSANRTASAIHDRMPVLLDAASAARWITRGVGPADQAGGLTPKSTSDDERQRPDDSILKPAADDFVVPTVVLRRVNSVRHDDPQCVTPVSEFGPFQQDLF